MSTLSCSGWSDIASLVWQHAKAEVVLEALRGNKDTLGWPSEDAQDAMVREVFEHTKDFPVSLRYLKHLLKLLRHDIESSSSQDASATMSDAFCELYISSVTAATKSLEEDGDDEAFFTYVLPSQEKVALRVQRAHNQVGLRAWEAGLFLADLSLSPSLSSLFAGRCVVELGAGVGCTGLLLAKELPVEKLVLTDLPQEVLDNLEHNVRLNGLDTNGQVIVKQLDWKAVDTEFVTEQEPLLARADVILAADCTYSVDCCFSLVNTIESLLVASTSSSSSSSSSSTSSSASSSSSSSTTTTTPPTSSSSPLPLPELIQNTPLALVASTLRNQETMDTFKHTLSTNTRLRWNDVTAWANEVLGETQKFVYSNRSNIRLFLVQLAPP